MDEDDGRFYLVDGEKFQAKNEQFVEDTQAVEPTFRGLNYINENKDYGFNLGFPIIRDKAWFWGSWGVQDIKTTTVYQRSDDTLLQNVAAKLNLQIVEYFLPILVILAVFQGLFQIGVRFYILIASLLSQT